MIREASGVVFLFAALLNSGCGRTAPLDPVQTANTETLSTQGSVNTVNVQAPFQEVDWTGERLRFFLPCAIGSDPAAAGGDTTPAATNTRQFACDLNIVKYVVGVTRSTHDLTPEFDKLRKMGGAKTATIGGKPAIDTISFSSGKTVTTVEGHPPTSSYFSSVKKTRTILFGPDRLVVLEAQCKTPEEGYCERLFNGSNEVTVKFFETVEVIK